MIGIADLHRGFLRFENHVDGQLESIIKHPGQKHFQQFGALLEARVRVGLNEPGVKLRIQNEVVPKDLEALTALVGIELTAHRFERKLYVVLDFR